MNVIGDVNYELPHIVLHCFIPYFILQSMMLTEVNLILPYCTTAAQIPRQILFTFLPIPDGYNNREKTTIFIQIKIDLFQNYK